MRDERWVVFVADDYACYALCAAVCVEGVCWSALAFPYDCWSVISYIALQRLVAVLALFVLLRSC